MSPLQGLFFAMLACIVFGCGAVSSHTNNGSDSAADSAPGSADPSDPVDTTDNAPASDLRQDVVLRGFVANGFEITVDGVQYTDMESYYTNEVDKLDEKVMSAGYEGYAARLDAEIGFADLWRGMTVYLAPASNRGVQAIARISSNGEFAFSLPKASVGATYKLRAIKRIGIELTRTTELRRFCFNFSALNKDVAIAMDDQPIVLDQFSTIVTKYECDSSPDGGLAVPTRDAKDASYGKIAPGMTKQQVLDAIGDDDLYIDSELRWCWSSPLITKAHVCATNIQDRCQCAVMFDEQGSLIEQFNVSADKLDIASW